jgi:hypothetical protein
MNNKKWINLNDQKPEEDRECFYYIYPTGVALGTYKKETLRYDKTIIKDCFNCGNGWKTASITHWMYRDIGDDWALPPEGCPNIPLYKTGRTGANGIYGNN